MSNDDKSWLPNMVGGVSIWKLARDLNQPQFFDGRLLVPETEGSDSLPSRVHWDLTGLVPLKEARSKHAADVARAIEELFARMRAVAKVMGEGGSGYDRYREAFTLPAIDADEGAHYFYSAAQKKVLVMNWGASPRDVAQQRAFLFGYQEFGDLIQRAEDAGAGSGGVAAAAGAAAGVAAAGAAAPVGAADAKSDEKKKDAEKDEQKKENALAAIDKRVWIALGVVLLVLLIAVLALWLWPSCAGGALGGSSDAGVDAAAEDEGAIYGISTDDAGPPPSEEAVSDAGAASADAGTAGGSEGSGSRQPNSASS